MSEKKLSRKWLYLAFGLFFLWVGFLLFMAITSSLKPPESKVENDKLFYSVPYEQSRSRLRLA